MLCLSCAICRGQEHKLGKENTPAIKLTCTQVHGCICSIMTEVGGASSLWAVLPPPGWAALGCMKKMSHREQGSKHHSSTVIASIPPPGSCPAWIVSLTFLNDGSLPGSIRRNKLSQLGFSEYFYHSNRESNQDGGPMKVTEACWEPRGEIVAIPMGVAVRASESSKSVCKADVSNRIFPHFLILRIASHLKGNSIERSTLCVARASASPAMQSSGGTCPGTWNRQSFWLNEHSRHALCWGTSETLESTKLHICTYILQAQLSIRKINLWIIYNDGSATTLIKYLWIQSACLSLSWQVT